MKKILLAFGAIIVMSSNLAVAQSKPVETKASILKTLRTKVVKGMISDGTPKEKAEKFGDCFTKDLEAKLSLEELKLFNKLNKVKEGQAPPKELLKQAEKMGLQEKMSDMGKDCGYIFQ
ncbi:hypothetical protein DBR32_13590 [Taibaiella sp. KBW10]|uniref:hypothetical protein n=1 Tax=Taibaiella sp. KBW10 TaxID=2153357 RepID=UPI000F59AFA7|nr:hypothetical protein [Taibaiella sp. KBW10]RQO29944.1 hypothetical protein DBR32_13590 [Taibaiella sp. KBW10]